MPWSDAQWWADNWQAVAAVAAAIAAVWAAARKVLPHLRRIGHLVDDLVGEPERPGVAARPGVMERLRELDERTAELRHNGGGSIKDAVHRIDSRVEGIDRRLAVVEQHTCMRGPQP
jgi:hypothetical protein